MPALILTNDALVLRAFAVLANAAPSNTDLGIHKEYIKDFGATGYIAALNDIFAGVSDQAMASLLLANTGLDTIDLEGDGNTDNSAIALAFIQGNAGNRVGAMLDLTKAMQGSALAPAASFNANFEAAYAYATNSVNVTPRAFDGTVDQILTTGMDSLTGGALDDFFKAYIVAGNNTFQDGDVLNGGAGNDTLFADINAQYQGFATTVETKGIENALFRVQNGQWDSGDNNIAGVGIIDAERMKDVLNWENNNSRADLVIEDIRINDNQITKDITITMRETDPGHVDYGVYFDQNSLRNTTENASQMNLRVLDTYAVAQGLDALKDSPYGAFTFYASIGGATATAVKLQSQAMQDAQTLEEMVAAMQVAADALFGANTVTVTLGTSYSVKDPVTSNDVTGNEIVIAAKSSGTQAIAFSTPAGSGWLATETVPAKSGLYTNFETGATTSNDLVTSTVVLDYVGRGSNGGDLVIGGLSVGATSSSQGVQRFEITVEDDSRLQTINSTNNSLREVSIVNGTQDRVSDAYHKVDEAGGMLQVNGIVAGGDAVLPGTAAQHNQFGFSDVRLIDGSAMTGKLAFTAEVTESSIAKYLDLTDPANDPAADNVAFVYSGGSNNDTMSVVVDSMVAASHTLSGREDFTFTLNGGSGDDAITLDIGGWETSEWTVDQKSLMNITVNGGDGNDTINLPGAGAVIVNAGTGNDTVYTDNTGDTATWVVNAAAGSTDVANLLGDAGYELFLYKGKLTVSLSGANLGGGVTGAAASDSAAGTLGNPYANGFEVVVDVPTGANYVVTQYYINQAIKKAINTDLVLSKLLVAEDGPADTLVIKSLIDGTFDADDLSLTLSGPSTLTSSEESEALAALQIFAHNSSLVNTDVLGVAGNGGSLTSLNGEVGFSVGAIGLGSVFGTGWTILGPVTEKVGVTVTGGLLAAETVTVDGLTVTGAAGVGASPSDVFTALVTGATVGGATVSGSYSGAWTLAPAGAASITYTSVVPGVDVANLLVTDVPGIITDVVTPGSSGALVPATLNGSASTTFDTDNVIDMGAGAADVLVLSTSVNANETLKLVGYDLGETTVVNFSDAAATSQDWIDFSAYLTSKSSASGSTASQKLIATTVVGAGNVDANDVVVLTGLGFDDATTGKTFAGLTADKLKAAINTTGNTAYSTIITDATLNAVGSQAATAVVGGVGKAVVLIENNQNLGEYSAFELTWNAAHATSVDFTEVKAIGVVDFGTSLALAADAATNLVG